MRARSIKPGICDNELLGTADPYITLLFERLWMMADRQGRLEDRPLRIKAQAFPYRDGLDVEPMLAWLHGNKFIQRYSVDGVPYIQVLKFLEHQKPHQNEKASILPAPKVESEHNQGAKHLALTPSSLTPDSGLLTADREAARQNPKVWQEIKQAYPPGTFRASAWLLAERQYERLIDDAVASEYDLLKAVQDYFAQQVAKQSIGTQYVLSPDKFFSATHWRGPFPLPASKADIRLAGNLSVAADFVKDMTQ